MGEAKRRKADRGQGGPAWLTSGPLPGWITEEPGKHFTSAAEAWAEVVEITREVSPSMSDAERRSLRMVFYTGALGALQVLPGSHSYDHFETLMARRWEVFTRDCVLPYIRPVAHPKYSPELMQGEISGIVEHQHGYWQGGMRAAMLIRRAGVSSAALKDEIDAARKEVVDRHGEGRAIKPLSQRPPNVPPANRLHRELSWWARDDGAIIGAVIEDQVDHDFSWIVLERNERGLYNAIDCQASLPTQIAARDALHAAMSKPTQKTLDDLMPGAGAVRERIVEGLEEVSGVVFARCPKCGKPTTPGRENLLCDACFRGGGLDA
jgi:hypothetical protein